MVTGRGKNQKQDQGRLYCILWDRLGVPWSSLESTFGPFGITSATHGISKKVHKPGARGMVELPHPDWSPLI